MCMERRTRIPSICVGWPGERERVRKEPFKRKTLWRIRPPDMSVMVDLTPSVGGIPNMVGENEVGEECQTEQAAHLTKWLFSATASAVKCVLCAKTHTIHKQKKGLRIKSLMEQSLRHIIYI